MITFDAREIYQWADSPDADHQLPGLIRHLIVETIPKRHRLDIPSGSSVRLGGWDGLVVVDEGNEFLPAGNSGLEISCDKRVSTKATSDYDKRTEDPLGENIPATTFVFVTARRWTNKRKWVRERHENSQWADVRALDADDLVSWLEQAPRTAVWFAKLMGKLPLTDSEVIHKFEEREEILHKETRAHTTQSIQNLLAEFADLKTDNAGYTAINKIEIADPTTVPDRQNIELSAKVDVARNLIDRGSTNAARAELEELNNSNEDIPDALKFRIITNLGACALAEGNFEDARCHLYEAYELQPDSQKGIANAALAAQLEGNSERTMALACKARELDPRDSQATAILLSELWDIGDTERFEELIASEEWITKDKQCALVIAGVRMQQLRFAEATALCQSLIEDDGEYAYAHLTLSESLLRQAQTEIRTLGFTDTSKLHEAVEASARALDILPIDLQEQRQTALISRACAHVILGETDDALRELDSVLAVRSPRLDATKFNKGLVLLQVGRPAEARAAFEEIQDSELRAEMVLPLAEACLASGDAGTAVSLLDGSFSLKEPSWNDVLKAVALMRAEQATGVQDSLGPILQSSLEQHSNNPRLLTLSSIRLSLLGDPEGAEEPLIEALSQANSSDRRMILEELGTLYLKLGRFSEAADTHAEIVAGVAVHPNALTLLYCLLKSNRLGEALSWAKTVRQLYDETPRAVIETEAHVLEQVGDIQAAISRHKELCSRIDSTDVDRVGLAMAQLRCGKRHAALETVQSIKALSIREHPEIICALAKVKRALGAPDYLDDAYLALRYGFSNPEIHKTYLTLFLYRDDKNIPDPEYIAPGCAVLLKDESEQWWYILDEGEEPSNQYELSSDNELAEHLIGRRTGETVTLRSGLEDLSYEIIGIQNKFVRACQETMKEFSTRFPSDTAMSRIKIEDKDFTKFFSIVDQRSDLVHVAEKAYAEGKLPLSTFASLIGRTTFEVWQECTKHGTPRIRFGNGSDKESSTSLQLLQESNSVVLDMTALFTAYELGLAEHLMKRFERVSVPQHVIDEVRQISFDMANFAPSGYLNKDIGGGYALTEVSDDVWIERQEYVQSVLEFAESLDLIAAYPLLDAADDPAYLAETLTYAGVGAVFAGDEQPATGQILVCDDLGLSKVARSLGKDVVNTQALLYDLLRTRIITVEEHSSFIEKLVLLNYWFVRVGPDDIVRRLEANGYMTSKGTRAMLKTLEDPDCSEDSAVRVGAEVIIALAGNIPHHQLELILAAVIASLKQGREGSMVLQRFRNEISERFAITPHLQLQILQSIDLYIRV